MKTNQTIQEKNNDVAFKATNAIVKLSELLCAYTDEENRYMAAYIRAKFDHENRYYPISKYETHLPQKGVAFVKRAIMDAIYYLTRTIECIHTRTFVEVAMPKLQIVDAFSGKILFEC